MNIMEDLAEYFPSCTMYDVPQRTEVWKSLRRPLLTASDVGEWVTEQPTCRMTIAEIKSDLDEEVIEYPAKATRDELLKLLPVSRRILSITKQTEKARLSAICKILGQRSTVIPPDEYEVDPDGPPPRNPSMWAVWNGLRLEAEAIASFEWETGLAISSIGFCQHKRYAAGCSPDGLVAGLPEGLENKCPLPHTHVRYLLEGVLPDEYKPQVHFSMAITGAKAWHFQSYCPGLRTFRLRIKRDEYTEAVEDGLRDFTRELNAMTKLIEAKP